MGRPNAKENDERKKEASEKSKAKEAAAKADAAEKAAGKAEKKEEAAKDGESRRRRRGAAEVLKSATLVKKGYECNSKEHDYGEVASVKACADKCKATKGCNFFVFGTGDKAGKCDWEKTTSASCPEGWQKDEYDFYKMNGASAKEEDRRRRRAPEVL